MSRLPMVRRGLAQRSWVRVLRGAAGVASLAAAIAARGDTWPMKHRDPAHTGRSDFVVPIERQNASFFNIPRWQTPSPGSPTQGYLDSGGLVFFDGAGPGGADLCVAGYHWPKGIQGLDRHSGRRFWSGNPAGGETIGTSTPAFANDGSTVFVVNDATSHPFMAFAAGDGPAVYRHNGGDAEPDHLSMHSPTVAADGRIFLHRWVDRPYAGADFGTYLAQTWAAGSATDSGLSDSSLYSDGATLFVVSGARYGAVVAHDGASGAELWRSPTPSVDATATIDPANGNVYVPAGDSDIYVVGLDRWGFPLWSDFALPVYDYQPGVNEPHRAQAAGCLSHDGATFYFQTNSNAGDGLLFAIHTANGAVKWTYPTASAGWEMIASSPIVTPNGILVVGNNDGGAYLALRDDGNAATLLDTLLLESTGLARATPALSADGLLYLPARLVWTTPNGDGDVPTFDAQNLFSAFDLNADASVILPAPPWQVAIALNHAVDLTWRPILDPNGQFASYAVYRDTAPFATVAGKTPIGTVTDVNATQYRDDTALNGVQYYYAVTTRSLGGGEQTDIESIGPRTPRDEDDLQILNLSRTPRFPRYDPLYTYYQVTDPSGFGPYGFSAATGLGSGQSASTQRWPNVGDTVTYTATVRNRGTNAWAGTLSATWRVDGSVHSQPAQDVSLAPWDTTTFAITQVWDGALHDVAFELNVSDDRPDNDAMTIQSRSVGFLTYVDASYVEWFREVDSPQWPQAYTDDALDFLNHHMARFNEMFAAAGSDKRVHYEILHVTRDGDPDPDVPRINFAIFPFRFYATDGSVRWAGYYSPADDIDYGLLHEMGHQLGLIDLYRLNVDPSQNLVNGEGYYSAPCLMNGVDTFISSHSASAMNHWINTAHGYYGQYLYSLPETVRLRVLAADGQPLEGATITVYQKCERPGLGEVITEQVKAQGVTGADGAWTLPNVPVDPQLVPTTYAGDTLHASPFGYVAVVGTNGVFLIHIEHNGFAEWTWLDIVEVNNAYWAGQTQTATIDRATSLGGSVQRFPPPDLAERNAQSWKAWAAGGSASATNDPAFKQVGGASVKMVTDGGFDTYLRYPDDPLARWDLSGVQTLRLWCYAINPNLGFQNQSPWIRLGNADGYFEWRATYDILNLAIGNWREFVIPVSGDGTWIRSQVGTPSLDEVHYFELHADTWGAGFTLWLDGVRFEPSPRPTPGDLNCDGSINGYDIEGFALALTDPTAYAAQYPQCFIETADVNVDGSVNGQDIQTFVDLLLGP